LNQVNHDVISSVEHASATIQDLILTTAMPEDMVQEIYDAFDSE
jgi:phosphoenolpyruvate synthase/pyruvate phosphate dikinase